MPFGNPFDVAVIPVGSSVAIVTKWWWGRWGVEMVYVQDSESKNVGVFMIANDSLSDESTLTRNFEKQLFWTCR